MRKPLLLAYLFIHLLLVTQSHAIGAQDHLVAEMNGTYATGVEFNLWISSRTGSIQVDYGSGELTTLSVSTDPGTPTKVNGYATAGKAVKVYGEDITALRCFWNHLTSLTLQAPELEILHCHTNQIASLDLSMCPKLRVLDATDAGLESLKIKGLIAMETLVCDGNHLSELDLSGMTHLTLLECFNNELSHLDLRDCSDLAKLATHKNKLTTLQVAGLARLETLSCWRNQIEEIDLSAAVHLNALDCSENKLTKLILSPSAPLDKIELYNNQLSTSAFSLFVETLPDLSGKAPGTLKAIKPDTSTPEGNIIDRKAYRAALSKNWKIYKGYEEIEEPEGFAYPTSSYRLSEDKTTLVKWLGEESEIDMTQDEALARISTIGEEAFSGNRDVTCIILPENATSIGFEAFRDCNMLREVFWSDAMTEIGDGAFSSCKMLQAIDFKHVGKIGDNCFSGCRSLKTLFIPEFLTDMGYAPFVGCTQLQSVEVSETNDWYSSLAGVLLSKTRNHLWLYPPAKETSEYEIPPSVTVVAGRAFDNCKKIETLHIGGRMTAFGKNALFNCNNLKLITCRALTPPEIHGDAPLNGINTATCVLKVYQEALQAYATAETWSSFTNIQELERPEGISPDSYLLSPDGKTLLKWLGREAEIDMASDTRLNGVETIATDAFTLVSVLGDSETSNMSLLKLTLSENMKTLKETALWCTELQTLILNEGLETIEEGAISGPKIKKIDIPGSVSRIDCNGLFNCFLLERVNVAEANHNYYSINGLLVDRDGDRLLLYPAGRPETTTTLPTGIKRIGRGAFLLNQKLLSIKLPEGVTRVDSLSFYACAVLQEIDMPSTLTYVADRAFNSNELLEVVIVRSTTVPGIAPYKDYRGVFHRISEEAILYVPDEAQQAYKDNQDWSLYFSDVRPLSVLATQEPSMETDDIVKAVYRDGTLSLVNRGAPQRISIFLSDGTIVFSGIVSEEITIPVQPRTVYFVYRGKNRKVHKIITPRF